MTIIEDPLGKNILENLGFGIFFRKEEASFCVGVSWEFMKESSGTKHSFNLWKVWVSNVSKQYHSRTLAMIIQWFPVGTLFLYPPLSTCFIIFQT